MKEKSMKQIEIEIREECPEDYAQTEEMTMRAFWNLHGPGCDEHLLVHKLRKSDIYIPKISRIAVMNEKIVGTIMYSSATLQYGEIKKEILTFGPLCVDPAAQDYGVGGRLLEYTLEIARKAGYDAIVIFGEPKYYPKHGFVTCDHLDVTTMDGGNFDAFMGYELKPGILTHWAQQMGCKGKFSEGEVFENLSMEQADELAKEFMPLLKLRIPCQWNYENASQDKDGYELVDGVQHKKAFQNMFNLYAHDLSEYNPWLASQVSDEGNYLEKQVEEYFEAPNKKPYLILCEGRPAGLLVIAGFCANPMDSADKDNFAIEEMFVSIPYRGKGIADNIVQRVWKQIRPEKQEKKELICKLSILPGNERAIHFWEKMIRAYGTSYTKKIADNGMWNYCIQM